MDAPVALYDALVLHPLQHLYVRGVWGNLPLADICAQLTKHRSEFWLLHPGECSLIVRNNFDGWFVWGQFVAYIAVIYCALRCAWSIAWHFITVRKTPPVGQK